MNSIKKLLVLIFMALVISVSHAAKEAVVPPYQNPDLSTDERITDLIGRMTLEEKVTQMVDRAASVERLGIPEYGWWNECLHGVARSGIATVFPQAIGLGATFDKDLMFAVGDVISDEARAKYNEALRNNNRNRYYGLTFWTPNINIVRDPRWGRGQETYGEDPYLTGRLGVEFVKGLQGNDPKYLKIAATAKHFAVHNGPEPDRHHFDAIVGERDLYETYLPAFEDLVVDANVESVMGAYNRVNGVPACSNGRLLLDILRGEWGFDGHVVSDCGAIWDIYSNHKYTDSRESASAEAVMNGCDLNCGGMYKYLVKAVNDGILDESFVDLSLYRLLRTRFRLGMFDPAEMVPYNKLEFNIVDSEEHCNLARKAASESIVLLKNDGILPLKKAKLKTVAVVGPCADDVPVLLGNYNGTPSSPVTTLDGLREALEPDVKVLYSMGCELVEGYKKLDSTLPIPSKYLSANGKEGFLAEYFDNKELNGEPKFTTIETEISHNWGTNSPTEDAIARGELSQDQAVGKDKFSVRWTSTMEVPETKAYEFVVRGDDGYRMFIDGQKVLSDWGDHSPSSKSYKMDMKAGQEYEIKVEYYESASGAEISLALVDRDKNDSFNDAIQYTKQADVAVFVGGISAQLEGEEMRVSYPGFHRGDKTSLDLPAPQIALLKEMAKTGTPVILVLNTGSALSINWENENLSAIALAWYPGQQGGNAIADVLLGKFNPAGRLPVTFYKSMEQLGDFADYNMEGKTYRYFRDKPLYEFGYGLSYSNFKYSGLKVSKSNLSKCDTLTVSFKIKNTGKYDGQEVPQLYVRDIESDMPMPVKQLRNFDRVFIKKGQTKTITMTLEVGKDFRYYNEELKSYDVDPGKFEIQIGSSSDDIRLKKTVEVK